MKIVLRLLLLSSVCLSCIDMPDRYQGLPPGEWRAALKIYDANQGIDAASDQSSSNRSYLELPFNFEVVYDSPDSFHLVFRNADEKIVNTHIRFGLDRATAFDTITIDFPTYDTYFKGILDEGIIEGTWHVNYKENYSIPFIAYHGQNHRFSTVKTNAADFNGRWDITFDYDTDNPYKAIGIFDQEGNYVEGTIMTETGDYRFLEGEVQNQKMKLSVFDGAHAFYFEAKNTGEEQITGFFKSGKHYTSNWIATRNEDIALADPFALTTVTDEPYRWDMEFRNLNNQLEPLSNIEFQDADIKIFNIIGSWCPNCKDETRFLIDFLSQPRDVDISMTSICFERYKDDIERNLNQIQTYKDNMGIPWRMLYGGYASKQLASEMFPFLNKIISYPTMVIIDRQGKIKHIHTGFNGPATPEFESFKTTFANIINELK